MVVLVNVLTHALDVGHVRMHATHHVKVGALAIAREPVRVDVALNAQVVR